jgi:hypothetical protein
MQAPCISQTGNVNIEYGANGSKQARIELRNKYAREYYHLLQNVNLNFFESIFNITTDSKSFEIMQTKSDDMS